MDRQTDRRTDKSDAYCPLPYGRWHNNNDDDGDNAAADNDAEVAEAGLNWTDVSLRGPCRWLVVFWVAGWLPAADVTPRPPQSHTTTVATRTSVRLSVHHPVPCSSRR